MKKNKDKNVFISHHSKDDHNIGKLRTLLKKRRYNLKNSSVDSSRWNRAKNENYIRRLLRLRIHWAGTCIVLLSGTTHTRSWVNWEIEAAAKKGKRIIGVHCQGATDCELPEALKQHGSAVVGWNSERIIDALEGRINNFENPDGTLHPALYPEVSRGNC